MGKKLGMCWRVPSYVLILWKICLAREEQIYSANFSCQAWPVRNRFKVRRRISLTHKEQTCGARDLMDEDYLMTVLTREDLTHGAKTYFSPDGLDPWGTGSWCEGWSEWIERCLYGLKSLWVRVTLASIIPKFYLISLKSNILLS